MKLAFLISAHTDATHLARLIKALPQESHFFVHIDRKSDITPFMPLADDPRVTFTRRRIDVTWGSFRQVEYQMELLETAMASGEEYDYLIALSGLDYPILPAQRLTAFFEQDKGREWLQGIDITQQPEDSEVARLYRHHRYLACYGWRYGSLGSKMRVALREISWALGRRKPLTFNAGGRTWRLHKGSSWWAITPQLATLALDAWHNNREYVDYFRNSFGPDETFIHTLAFNTPEIAARCIHTEGEFVDLEQVTPLTYIHYKPEIKILTAADYDTLIDSGKVFCRKTVTGVSDELMDLLER